ncbi:MAG: radical SAM protein [Thermodesulfobacteriota bacterium]
MALIINEIFYSIQGESIHAGRPCVFVRLTGCNLRCVYCDTRYAYTGGTIMEIPTILHRVAGYGCRLVEVTGGEPLCQQDTPLLIQSLLAGGYSVLLETNGTYDVSRLDRRCIKIIDIKCPGSGESQKNDLDNLKHLGRRDQLKFVIGDREDYIFAKGILRLIPIEFPQDHILFSTVHEKMALHTLAEWILQDNLNVRLHLQLHKFIWPDIDRGV